MCEAVKVLIAGGKERSAALRGSVGAATADMAALNIGESGLGVEGVVRELQSALSEEIVLALGILKEGEDKAAAAAAAAEVNFLRRFICMYTAICLGSRVELLDCFRDV